MRGHNVCFYRSIRKIIPKLFQLCLLIWTTGAVHKLFFNQTTPSLTSTQQFTLNVQKMKVHVVECANSLDSDEVAHELFVYMVDLYGKYDNSYCGLLILHFRQIIELNKINYSLTRIQQNVVPCTGWVLSQNRTKPENVIKVSRKCDKSLHLLHQHWKTYNISQSKLIQKLSNIS